MGWCPDLDGPCVKPNRRIDEEDHAVVYCLHHEYCNETLFLPDRQEHLCTLGQVEPDPNVPEDQCSPFYYQCVYSNGLAIWEQKFCEVDDVYSPILNKCTSECNENPTTTTPRPTTPVPDPDDDTEHYDNCFTNSASDYCDCWDDLNLAWKGSNGENVTKNCSEASDQWEGLQFWKCESGHFSTEFPDRRNCQEKWLPDFIDAVESTNTSSYDDSKSLEDHLDQAGQAGAGVTEDALNELVEAMEDLLEKRKGEMNEGQDLSFEKQNAFYKSYMNNIDKLMGVQTFKWLEKAEVGFRVNFGYINNSIELGRLVTTMTNDYETVKNTSFEYEGPTVKSQAIFNLDINQNLIFSNENISISIDKDKLPENCHANGVITYYKDLTNRFPQTFNGKELTLSTSTVDYTLFEKMRDDDEDDELEVVIEFNHENQTEEPICVYYDPTDQQWLSHGCSVLESNSIKTRCQCNHLTNFGLLFGGSPSESKDSFAKDLASKVIGGLSIALLICTQVVLFKGKNKNIAKQRKVTEMNRNLCLILAFTFFVYLSDVDAIRNESLACTGVTFISHYLWLATFSWICKFQCRTV